MSALPSLKRAVALCLAVTAALIVAAPTSSTPEGVSQNAPSLPPNIHLLSSFGERASWSPDGHKLAFMTKTFGECLELDLLTRKMTVLNTVPTNPGFMRVQYLPNGDYILIGASTFTDSDTTRHEDQELWVLRSGEGEPIPLNHKVFEGVAISKVTQRIAWANTWQQYPDQFAEGESAMYIADIDYFSGTPVLSNKREVMRGERRSCVLEPQDFRYNDTELIYNCYVHHTDVRTDDGSNVFGINLETGDVTTYRDVFGEYNEVEGIYPNEEYALVESAKGSRTNSTTGVNNIDLWRLRLEPNSTDFVRLTYFTETHGWKASNPVVSPDGRTVAFQAGRSGDAPGVGHGLYLLELE